MGTDPKRNVKEDAPLTDVNGISGFMIDMDGTVYKGDDVIPGAPEFVERLMSRKIPFVFLTNNSSSDRRHYYDKLKKMGFSVSIENILTSTTATIQYLKKYHDGKKVYPLGTEKFTEEIKDAGIRMSKDDADIVLLAFDTSITYEKINHAYRLLKKGAEFVATHPDDLCPTENGYDVDIGPFIRFFESMTGTKATVIGKPNVLMVRMAAERMNVPAEGMVMVGDRLYTDIKMASDAGIRSIMVLTGEAKETDIKDSGVRPTLIVSSVNDILK
ncbi:MAG: HAD-IIA family hydrolase [Methanomassiliicoccaceae archaeon]|nr:HAD-IIA family hydrolase [Methanomassiliicoccaceae archaeon]